jgi:hypothetical protein
MAVPVRFRPTDYRADVLADAAQRQPRRNASSFSRVRKSLGRRGGQATNFIDRRRGVAHQQKVNHPAGHPFRATAALHARIATGGTFMGTDR